jgi:hypothetical protein
MTLSLYGASACFPALATDGFDASATAALFQRVLSVQTGNLSSAAANAQIVRWAVPILFLFALPYLLYLLAHDVCPRRFESLLVLDQYAVKSPSVNGRPLILVRTPAGGALFIATVGLIVALMTATLLNFLSSNTLLQSASLPLDRPTQIAYSRLPPQRLDSTLVLPSDVAVLTLLGNGEPAVTGFVVAVQVQGRLCAALTNNASSLLTGAFSYAAVSNSTTGWAMHSWSCSDCVSLRYRVV